MDWMKVLSDFVQAMLLAIAPVLGVFVVKAVIAWGKKLAAEAKEANPDLFEQMQWVARTAVKAAEQSGAVTLGQEKKAYAINIIEKWLESKGVTIDVDAIDAVVEAAVYDYFGKANSDSVGFIKD
jgi:Bacteriophage holin of superfamily 6 (Holin_LLH)